MADVFLSYKREDAAKVRKLVAALRESGLDTWWDEDIPASAPWEATIEKELAAAKAVIVCWSPDAVASENVRSEARVARQDGRLIQVFLKPCTPPLFFGERQGVDLSNWRGKADDPRISEIAESVPGAPSEKKAHTPEQRKPRHWFEQRVHIGIGILILLAGSLAGWWLMAPAKAEGPQTVAVLPFRALNPADTNLVDAIWDDTRGAISKNPNLRVLGRQAVDALAKQDLTPADYRKKVGADYLLDGSVQHVGDQVRMKFSLTRTKDGSEVWADEVGGKLDDVFAFQQRVANEVEGRIRGRVAPGGGIKDKNIATSGEVYAIYADAIAKMRKRDRVGFQAAIPLLKKAVALDPNYAPAWARLGQAYGMGLSRTQQSDNVQMHKDSIAFTKRALELAPNLAHAHAVYAMVHNFAPELDSELRKAVQLDPGDVEAWGWLANSLQFQNRLKEALVARDRAVQIEPLWYWTSANKLATLSALRDINGINAEIERVKAIGDPVLTAKIEGLAASQTGRPGDAIRILLRLRSAHPDEASWVDDRITGDLMALGYVDEAMVSSHQPAEFANEYRGTPATAQAIRKDAPKALDLWTEGGDAIAVYGRELPKFGRMKEYLGYYDGAFKSPEELFALWDDKPAWFLGTAPTLAANLRAVGRKDEAEKILAHAQETLDASLKNGPPAPPDVVWLAYLRGAQDRDDEAIQLLNRAVEDGWIPNRQFEANDIAEEPAFASLVNRADFQAIRQRIFARIAEERRKVPLQMLAQAYPTKQTKAAA
jgi:TolB-like protein